MIANYIEALNGKSDTSDKAATSQPLESEKK